MFKNKFSTHDFLKELGNELILDFDRASRATTPGIIGGVREFGVRKKTRIRLTKYGWYWLRLHY